MKGIVEQYAKGEFNVVRPEVNISVDKINLSVEAGTVHTGSFRVTTGNDVPIKFMAYDSRYILDFQNHTYVGKKKEVFYAFDATGYEPGKSFKGHINIITDGGEFKLPYVVDVTAPFVTAGDKRMEDLFQFASYAEENFEGAMKLFDSPDFVRAFLQNDPVAKGVYDTLKNSASRGQAMEEFLVFTHKKRVLTLTAKQKEITIEMPDEMVRGTISINKNTWGYTHTYITSDCEFLIPESTRILTKDFIGNNFDLDFLIDPDKIPEGATTGYIYFTNALQKISVKINIRKPITAKATPKNRHANFMVKKGKEALLKAYIDFRTDKLELSEYTERSRKAIETIIRYRPEESIFRLGLLHMKLLEGKTAAVSEEFVRIDADVDVHLLTDMERSYYGYLKALLTRDHFQIEDTVSLLRKKLAESDGDKLFYFWLLIFLDQSYAEDKWILYGDIEKLYSKGVNSPIIYFEMIDMFNKQPLMMKRTNPLELSAMRWGMRHEFVSEDVIVEFVKTASRMREFEPHVFKLLEQIYQKKHDRETLSAICDILILNRKHDSAYHQYFRDAAERGIKQVGLYEGFLQSMDKRTYAYIPEPILRYFTYKNNLSDDILAYLYANIIMNKVSSMNIYNEYVPAIEAFMEKKVMEGAVSDDLTVIYQEFLTPENVKQDLAARLINIIFKRKFICANKNIVAVIVSHPELEKSEEIKVVDGEAYFEIISNSATITLLDKKGGRYVSTISYRLEPIVDEEDFLDICREYSPKDYRLLLHEYNEIDTFSYKDASEINLAREISSALTTSYELKQEALLHMVEYYHENFDDDILQKYLERIDLDYLHPSDAARIISYYTSLRMYDQAFAGVHKFGYEDVDVDELIRLAEHGIGSKKYQDDRTLLSICVYLYKRGYASSKILTYLISEYNGSLEEMAELFKAVNTNYKNIDMLSENILAQMMFANGYTESIYDIFGVYYYGRSRGMVVKAFLKFLAHQYIIRDMKLPNEILECLYKEVAKGNISDEISQMALLSYFADCKRYDRDQKEWIVGAVRRFVDGSKVMPFFKEFAAFVPLPDDMKFKTYIIFKGESGNQVWVSFSFGQEAGNMANYRSERMNEIIPGIYIKELVVFHGESLIYSIDGEQVGTSSVVESDILKSINLHRKDSNRFELINSMLVSQETRNDKELLQAMDTYLNNTHFFEENLILL